MSREPLRIDPDANLSDAEIERLAQALGGKIVAITHHEKNGNGRALNWFLGLTSLLLAAGIVGLWNLNGQVQAQAAKEDARYEATKQQLANIENRLDVRMRGGMLGEPPDSSSP